MQILIKPILTYGSEGWTLNLDIDKICEKKILRGIFEAAKVDSIWKKRCNRVLENLIGDLDLVYLKRINKFKWFGHENRMDADRIPKSVFNILREIDSEVNPGIIAGNV